MAYILSTPIRRSTVITTQLVYLIGSLFVTFGSLAVNFLICNTTLADKLAYANDTIVYINLGAFLVALALSGICFAASGIFNLSKYSIGTGGMIVVAFLMLALIGSFSTFGVSGLDVFKNLTIISLFNVADIIANAHHWVAHLAVLGGIAAVTYAIGGIWFTKKDLPL
jgi:ABC-2 type transport system permease protein